MMSAATMVLAAAAAHARPHLLIPGVHMARDLGSLNGVLDADGWLALTDDGSGFQLRETRLHVRSLSHPLSDAPALSIDADAPGEVRVLFHGVPTAQAGPVPTTYAGSRTLVPGTWQTVGASHGGTLVLVASDDDGQTDPELLDLHSPAYLRVQLLPFAPAHGQVAVPTVVQDLGPVDGTARLLWAGDLDGDDVTDLLLDETTRDGVTRARLWLSSDASTGEIVAEAAVFEATGC